MENAPIIYFVVPCYNEEEVLPLTAGILGKKLVTLINAGVIGEESRILLVDDGSRDGTWKLIENLNREDGGFSVSKAVIGSLKQIADNHPGFR